MKKLMTLMIGMSLMFGTVAAVFGQETPKKKILPKRARRRAARKRARNPRRKAAAKLRLRFSLGRRVASSIPTRQSSFWCLSLPGLPSFLYVFPHRLPIAIRVGFRVEFES